MKTFENFTLAELKVLAGFQNEEEFTAFSEAVKEPATEYKVENQNDINVLKKLAVAELVSRIKTKKVKTIKKTSEAIPYFQAYGDKPVEYFLLLTLDTANKVIKLHEVTKGLVNRVQVHPREVFKLAIEDNATRIIVAHNHPSGSLEESVEDLAITDRLKKTADIIGIELIDHIIVTKDGRYKSII